MSPSCPITCTYLLCFKAREIEMGETHVVSSPHYLQIPNQLGKIEQPDTVATAASQENLLWKDMGV